ncbi:MAG: NADH-quinone oxidoreductase subunit N [Anaerolineales bacterium]
MTFAAFQPSMLLVILPEILLLLLAGVVLVLDAVWRPSQRSRLGWVSGIGIGIILLISLYYGRPGNDAQLIFGGTLRHDWTAYVFKILFLFAAAMTSLLSIGFKGIGDRGEYYALIMVSTIGMSLMAAASDLVMLYLAIESTSIPLYILAGFLRRTDASTEAGLKYFLFGALTSTVMLYGFSLLYGLTGQTNIYRLAGQLVEGQISLGMLIAVAALILVGFGFKVAAVPFHFWTPDVYQGAPTPITAFISTASKAAGFAVLLRFMLAVFPGVEAHWTAIISALSVGTMTLGNLLALAQSDIKRMLAYSSIAHAGYALIGLVAVSTLGAASVLFYLMAYVVTNLAAFGVVVLFAQSAGSDEIQAYAGLSRRAPGLAIALMVALLSLAGMPPLAGFVAKVYVFAAAVQSGLIWLAVAGILNSIIGLYYYMTVLKVVYLYRSDDEDKPIAVPRGAGLALVACSLAIIVIGTLSAPWLDWALTSARSLF